MCVPSTVRPLKKAWWHTPLFAGNQTFRRLNTAAGKSFYFPARCFTSSFKAHHTVRRTTHDKTFLFPNSAAGAAKPFRLAAGPQRRAGRRPSARTRPKPAARRQKKICRRRVFRAVQRPSGGHSYCGGRHLHAVRQCREHRRHLRRASFECSAWHRAVFQGGKISCQPEGHGLAQRQSVARWPAHGTARGTACTWRYPAAGGGRPRSCRRAHFGKLFTESERKFADRGK